MGFLSFSSCNRKFLIHEVVPLISLAVLWLRHSDHSLSIKDSAIFDKTRCLISRERRTSFSVAHLILKRVLYSKKGTKLYFSDGKVRQCCCFSLWSALMPSPGLEPIFPSVHPPGGLQRHTKTAQQMHPSWTVHPSCLPWPQKHLGRMAQPVPSTLQDQGGANPHTRPWEPWSAPACCSSDRALDARR